MKRLPKNQFSDYLARIWHLNEDPDNRQEIVQLLQSFLSNKADSEDESDIISNAHDREEAGLALQTLGIDVLPAVMEEILNQKGSWRRLKYEHAAFK